MRKAYLLPSVAIAGGLVGLFLRQYQSKTAFEMETGLLIPGQPVTLVLLLLAVFMAMLMMILPGRRHHAFSGGYDEAFHNASMPVLMMMTASAFLMGSAGFFHIQSFIHHEGGFVRLGLGVFCLLAAFSILRLAKSNYRNEQKGNGSVFPLFPAYACCLWIMSCYQTWAQNPVTNDYVFSLLGVLGGMLSCYFIAKFAFERPKVYLTCTITLFTICFALIAFADGAPIADSLLLGGLILYLIPSVFALLRNDGEPEPAVTSSDSEHPVKEDTI